MDIIRRYLLIFFTAIIIIFLPGCISTSANQNVKESLSGGGNESLRKQIDNGDIFQSRNVPPKISTIGIIKPEVSANSHMTSDEMLMLDIIKNSFSSNFTQFAKGKIVVVNLSSEVAQARNDEIERSLSGSSDELSLVLRTAARAILTGEVIKQSQTRFILSFTVIETETGVQLASYSKTHSDIEISSGRAVNLATEELLKQLNVVLNEAGKLALYGTSNEGETALAKGNEAANSGQSLQAMNYLFNAASYNTTASQASARLSTVKIQNQKELQGEGGRVMDFFQRQTFWQDRINEYNEFYNTHLPFELYYTPPKISNERVEGNKKLYNLGFEVGLRWNKNQISAMEKVLHEYILDGLKKNNPDEVKRWELKGLPEDSYLFKGPDNFVYDLVVQIENERGDVITSGGFQLYGSLFYDDGKIYALCTQGIKRVFENMEYDESKMTNHLYVRVTSVNGINIQTAGESGFLRVVQTQGNSLPPTQRNNLPFKLASKLEYDQKKEENRHRKAMEDIEKKYKKEREAAEEKQKKEQIAAEERQKREQIAAEKRQKREQEDRDRANHSLLHPHLNVAAYGGPVYSFGAQTINLDFGLSLLRYISLDFGGLYFFGIQKNVDSTTLAEKQTPFGLRAGMSLFVPGPRMVLKIAPAYTMLFLEKKDKKIYFDSEGKEKSEKYLHIGVGSLSAFLDLNPFGRKYGDGVFLRLGYRLDVYPAQVAPIFGKPEGSMFISHNFMAGLVCYLGT